jgi:tetratricopeptide (TPR) repeat protein
MTSDGLDLPRRPRAHQLNREAVEAFRRVLPPSWVPRTIEPDYGIDEQVEIFDPNGVATGRSFLVQLKGTDEALLPNALRVRLKSSTVSYLREQDLPVLIVRYHAPTSMLFAKWFHTFDPHYGRGDQRTVTFHLIERDRWNDETPDSIVQEVERFRYLRSQRLHFPLTLRLAISAETIQGLGRGALRLGARALFERVRDIAQIAEKSDALEDDPHVVTITIAEDETVVNDGSAPTVTLHHTFNYSAEASQRIPADVVVAVALWLGQLRQFNEAARVASAVAHESNAIRDLETLAQLAGFFAASHRVVDALELAENVRRAGADVEGQILASAILWNAATWSASEQRAVEGFLRRAATLADNSGNMNDASVAHYNLGNFLRARDNDEAFAQYSRAAELDPEYIDRPYFCAELGGVLFHLDQFEAAAHFYERALGLGADEFNRALLADSLMYAGEYGKAAALFQTYLEADPSPPSEFALKGLVLPGLVEAIGERQQRRTSEAIALAGVTPDSAAQVEAFEAALQEDALCSLAWFNRGVSLSRGGEPDRALHSFLLAALTSLGDVEAWANAFGLALGSRKHLELAPQILAAAYRLNGTKLLERLAMHARSQREGFPADRFLEAVDEILAVMPQEWPQPRVRFLGEEAYKDLL